MLDGTPGIPQFLGFGKTIDGRVWVKLKGIRNADSIEVVKGKKIIFSEYWIKSSLSRRIEILAKAAEILSNVHHAGFRQNDVKPLNIIVDDQGNVMVIDWEKAPPY